MTIRRKILRNTIKSMLWCYTYFLIFALVLPRICNTWFYSAYYSGDFNSGKLRQRVEIVNQRRFISAITYTRSLKNDSLKRFRFDTARLSDRKLDIVIGIVTANKDNVKKQSQKLGYLTQTTAGLLSAVLYKEYEEFKQIKIFICDVDTHPHPEARDMSELLDLKKRHRERVPNDLTIQDKSLKEKEDYVFCLELASKYRSRYVMLLEDDVILDENSFETLNHLIRSRITQSDWLFVKLFYPEKWTGYSMETERLCELFGVGVIGGLIFTFFKLCCSQCCCALKKVTVLISRVFLVGFWTCSIAAYVIGRQYVSSWRNVSPYTHRLVEAPGCRTHAVLYRATHVAELLLYLRGITATSSSEPFDNFMDTFADLRGYKRYLVEPNIGRHIGYVSNFESRNASEFLY